MENTKGKKGRTRLRIIDSDSESEDNDDNHCDDIAKLSKSLDRIGLHGESGTKNTEGFHQLDHDERIRNTFLRRTPPRGRNHRRIEDFSWSSSDEESEGSYSTTRSSNKNDTKKPASDGLTISPKRIHRFHNPSDGNFSTITPTTRKTRNLKTPSPREKSIATKLQSTHAKKPCSPDCSLSDFSSSTSDSDFSLSSTKSSENNSRVKGFHWSFNKRRQEYTISGKSKTPAFSIPSDLYNKLYDFQKDGIAWMAGLHIPKIGGILGDDMGMVNLTRKTCEEQLKFLVLTF